MPLNTFNSALLQIRLWSANRKRRNSTQRAGMQAINANESIQQTLLNPNMMLARCREEKNDMIEMGFALCARKGGGWLRRRRGKFGVRRGEGTTGTGSVFGTFITSQQARENRGHDHLKVTDAREILFWKE
jgi:hypothetical protein